MVLRASEFAKCLPENPEDLFDMTGEKLRAIPILARIANSNKTRPESEVKSATLQFLATDLPYQEPFVSEREKGFLFCLLHFLNTFQKSSCCRGKNATRKQHIRSS